MEILPDAHVTPSVKLLRRLSEGGMGSVWVAEHAGLGVEVAVKFLLGEHLDDPALRARFAREAAAASQVKSSHVVKVYDYGITDGGVPYLVMELLDGKDLRTLLDELGGRLPAGEVVEIVTQLARALERAHDAHVVHRDIKPENVFLCSEGGERFVKLLDFGIAKTTLARDGARRAKSTLAGASLGTPYYMSPEQFRNAKDSDPRSDLWGVGVLTYEAITGTLPFVADSVSAMAILVAEANPLPPSHYDSSIPAAFDAWFAKACAREPGRRFSSARSLAVALRDAFAPAPLESSLRVIVGAVDPTSDKDLALRATAFANEANAPPPLRTGTRAALVLGVVIAAGAASLALARRSHPDRPTAADRPPPALVVSVSAALPDPPLASTSAAPRAATAASRPPEARLAPRPPSSTASSASASSPKRDDRDIY